MLELAVAYLCHSAVVALALSTVGLIFELFHLLLVALNLVEECFLAFPLLCLPLLVGLERVDDLVEFGELVLVAFTLYGFALYL